MAVLSFLLPMGPQAAAQEDESLDTMATEAEPTPDTLETNHYQNNENSAVAVEMDSGSGDETDSGGGSESQYKTSARNNRAKAQISKLKDRLAETRHGISVSNAQYTKAERELQKTTKQLNAIIEKLNAAKKREKMAAGRAHKVERKLAAVKAKLSRAKKALRSAHAHKSKTSGRRIASNRHSS